jgi:NADPH:quinone reductase-like Zn-dependent oxidoreductase
MARHAPMARAGKCVIGRERRVLVGPLIAGAAIHQGDALLKDPGDSGVPARLDPNRRAEAPQLVVRPVVAGAPLGAGQPGREVDADLTPVESRAQRSVVENVGAPHARAAGRRGGGRLGLPHQGAYAVAREDRLAAKPATLSFEQAASLPVSALTALQAVRNQAKVKAGQRVMITGAGGGIGTFAVQLAKARGASVTGVCGPAKTDLVRSIGADSVIDYTRQEIDCDGIRYDVIIDISGSRPLHVLRRALAPRGTLVLTGGDSYDRPALTGMSRQVRAPFLSTFTAQRLRTFLARENAADYQTLAQLTESGALTPVIDRTYPLGEAAEAIRRIAAGHATGKGIIII